MANQVHTIGAGGEVANISAAGGASFIIPAVAPDGKMIANVIRRLNFPTKDGASAIDIQVSLQDALFIARSIIVFAQEDVELIRTLPNSTIFFTSKDGVVPQQRMIEDLREAAEALKSIASAFEAMPFARVAEGDGEELLV